jgi:hypothetical protein
MSSLSDASSGFIPTKVQSSNVQTWLTLRERTIGSTDANDTQLMTTSTQSNVRKVFLKIGHPDYRVQDKDIDKEV